MVEQITFETALEHVTTKIPLAAPADSAGQIRAEISGRLYECATHIVVCDSSKFLGVLKIEALLAGAENEQEQ